MRELAATCARAASVESFGTGSPDLLAGDGLGVGNPAVENFGGLIAESPLQNFAAAPDVAGETVQRLIQLRQRNVGPLLLFKFDFREPGPVPAVLLERG